MVRCIYCKQEFDRGNTARKTCQKNPNQCDAQRLYYKQKEKNKLATCS